MSELKLPSSVTGQRAAQQYLKFFSRDVANARDVYNQQLNDYIYHAEFGVEEPDFSEEDLRRQYNDANSDLQQYNDEEILANLDAAVAANSERIQTNNNHIAALDAVSNAYVEQSNAQTEATNAARRASQSQINADNAQTVSNMISALSENPTQQQIAMVKQAIQENPNVYGDQGATIISNLEANPPNIKEAGTNASAIASTTNNIAQTDQRAASIATTNATNAAKKVDNAKKAAVESGVSESNVSSPAAASSASIKLQQENANLTEVNNNVQNAKQYVKDRQDERRQQQLKEENNIRKEKNDVYNIGNLSPNNSTAELYDLRNINYTNFRGTAGNSSSEEVTNEKGEKTQKITYRSGASRSFYMHIDYVFSNDLNMSSIDPKYKQNIQPIILNEFQPDEMIQINDIIGGTLKGLDKGIATLLGFAGDLMKPATKFVTNVLIDKASKDPTILYPNERKNNKTPELKDLIFDPVLKVRNMFRGGKWLNTYELPFFNNNFLEANWSSKWTGCGITGDFGESVGKVIQDKFAIDYPSRPKFSINMSDAGRSPFDIEFYLINKDEESLKKNFSFLTAFYAGTSWLNLQGGFVRPPNVYNVICPGRFEIPWAAIDSTITFEGKLRKMSKINLGQEFSNIGLISPEMYWPDAWKMKIHIKDLSINNFNMYADYYKHGFNNKYYTSIEADMTSTIAKGAMASFGTEKVLENLVASENDRRSKLNPPKKPMTPEEEAEFKENNRKNARNIAAAQADKKLKEIREKGNLIVDKLTKGEFGEAIDVIKGSYGPQNKAIVRKNDVTLSTYELKIDDKKHFRIDNKDNAQAFANSVIERDNSMVNQKITQLKTELNNIRGVDLEREREINNAIEQLQSEHVNYKQIVNNAFANSNYDNANDESRQIALLAIAERNTFSGQVVIKGSDANLKNSDGAYLNFNVNGDQAYVHRIDSISNDTKTFTATVSGFTEDDRTKMKKLEQLGFTYKESDTGGLVPKMKRTYTAPTKGFYYEETSRSGNLKDLIQVNE